MLALGGIKLPELHFIYFCWVTWCHKTVCHNFTNLADFRNLGWKIGVNSPTFTTLYGMLCNIILLWGEIMQTDWHFNYLCSVTSLLGLFGKSSESVQCAITGPCLRMRHRPSDFANDLS